MKAKHHFLLTTLCKILIHSVLVFSDTTGLSDIVFAVDTTSSTNDLKRIVKFVIESVQPMDVEKGNVRVGLAKYSAKPSKLMDFADSNKATMELILGTVTSSNDESDLVNALSLIQQSFFGKVKSRQDAKKTVILFINGDRTRSDKNALKNALKALDTAGIGYIIISIDGTDEFRREIKEIGGLYGKVHALDGSSQLPETMPDVVKSGKGKTLNYRSLF